jgi:hypothetical protein
MANISTVGQLPSPPKTFTLFPELAAELKIKIWEYTFPEPRTITLKQKSRPHWDSNIHKIIHFSFGTCDEPRKLILLQVNREAREFTREKYQRRFLTVCGSSKYFNYERDVLKIELIDCHKSQWQYEIPNLYDNLKKVQTLVLESFRFYDDKLEDILKYTPGIKLLIIYGCSWFESSLSDRWTSAGSPAQIETDHDFRKSLEKLSGRKFRTKLEVSVLQSSSGNVWFPPRAQLRIKYAAVREEQH